MGDLTRNLSLHEFRCRCGCGLMNPHPLLVESLQEWVDRSGARHIVITGGGRCPARNRRLHRQGAAPDSPHLPHGREGWTRAADAYLIGAGLKLRDQLIYALQVPAFAEGGVGIYWQGPGPDRLHLDVRGTPARWAFIEGRKTAWQEAVRLLNQGGKA